MNSGRPGRSQSVCLPRWLMGLLLVLSLSVRLPAQTGILKRVDGYRLVEGQIADAKNYLTNSVRLRTTGTFIQDFGPGFFFLHDDTGDIRVACRKAPPVNRGDLVEVTGVPRIIEGMPWLQYAQVRKVGTGRIPETRRITAEGALQELYDAQIVTLRARVIGATFYILRGITNESLLFDSDTVLCKAIFALGTDAAKRFPSGTVADFTGVCRLGGRIDESSTHYVHILVHSPDAVRVIETPPFWSPAALRRIFVGIGIATVAALGWIVWQRRKHTVLERRVAKRTTELRAEVAAREQAEAELRIALQAEKELNQLKSSFVSMVSHEFRTPLEIILSSSNILDRYLERLPAEKRAAQLRAIRKSVHRMNDLIDDVLLLGKFDAGALCCQPVPLDLVALCRRAVKEIESAAARNGAIQFTTTEVNGDACADEGLLQHILTNILGNAVKYSPPDRAVEFSLNRRGTDAEFVIRDRGCGIPAADQARLFTAFYRGSNVGRTSGSGLGLVIAKRCVDLHGGTIRCESEVGAGTTFTVMLPLFDGTRVFRRRANGETEPTKIAAIS